MSRFTKKIYIYYKMLYNKLKSRSLREEKYEMKRLFTFAALVMAVFLLSGCSYLKKMDNEMNAVKYNDIRATFVTSQGEINFYLYPEAAPITVVNFINLAQRGYYNDNKIHRAVDNFIVQAGDPTETGRGGPGYTIPDETVGWLDFYQQGMLAMANAGPGTGGSQYFLTLYPADWLNGKHTIFGEYVADKDFEVMKKLEYGDVIKEIKFAGDIDFLLSIYKEDIEKWNTVLDEKFPNLKKYPIKNPEEFGGQAAQYREELEKIYAVKEKETQEKKESLIPRFLRSVEKKFKEKKSDKEDLSGETNEIYPNEEGALQISGESSDGIEGEVQTDNINNTETDEKSFWQKLKFWN